MMMMPWSPPRRWSRNSHHHHPSPPPRRSSSSAETSSPPALPEGRRRGVPRTASGRGPRKTSLSLIMGKRWCDAKTSPLFPIVHFISSLSCRHNKYSTTTTICSTHRVPRRFLSPPRRRRQSRRNTNNTNNVCGVVVRFVPIDGTKEEGELCDDDDAKTATR